MTALKAYERLEATGLWRPTPEDQRREVVVSIGEATLTITDLTDRALTHWSLAALDRLNPGQIPAIFAPDGDPDETLELAEDESEMIEAIEKLRVAVERARPRAGRLRLASVLFVIAAVVAVLVFWLPGALVTHTVSVVPAIKRHSIGTALLESIERVSGRACTTRDTGQVLRALATRTGARKLVLLRAGVPDSRYLVGGIILLNKSTVEDFEDPAVVAGYILAEMTRARQSDPLREMLLASGPRATFRLLTTGELDQATLDAYAVHILTQNRDPLPDSVLLTAFDQAGIPSSPYAYAVDVTGESVLGLIEADPLKGVSITPVLPDRDWVLLQNICGG